MRQPTQPSEIFPLSHLWCLGCDLLTFGAKNGACEHEDVTPLWGEDVNVRSQFIASAVAAKVKPT